MADEGDRTGNDLLFMDEQLLEDEVKAIHGLSILFADLDRPARRRVLDWALARFAYSGPGVSDGMLSLVEGLTTHLNATFAHAKGELTSDELHRSILGGTRFYDDMAQRINVEQAPLKEASRG